MTSIPERSDPSANEVASALLAGSKAGLYRLLGGFIAALLLVVGVKSFFSGLYLQQEIRTANERARQFVGEEILRGIRGVEKSVYRMAATSNAMAFQRLRKDVDDQVSKIRHDLSVLEEGGTVRQSILLNIEGRDEMVREIYYVPSALGSGYVMELIEIPPLLDQVAEKAEALERLLVPRWEYRVSENRKNSYDVEQSIGNFLKQVPPFFHRLDENANRLFYDSSERLKKIEAEMLAQRAQYEVVEIVLVLLVVALATLAGIWFSRQINASNLRLQQAWESMREAKEEAERASRAKSDFVSRMSHELRTPLNAILGFGQLLDGEPLKPSQKNYVHLINHSGQHLLELINQVLDIAKIEAGALKLESIPYDFSAIVDEVRVMVAERASSKGLTFVAQISNELPRWLVGDPTRLKQILINLTANAVKFTEKGSVELRVAPDEGRVVFSVRDTGIGMDELAKGKLFRQFGQADESTTRKFGGTGLGLVIARELVQAMGGAIEVDSAPGIGSCFWFSLPLAVGVDPVSSNRSVASPVTVPQICEGEPPLATQERAAAVSAPDSLVAVVGGRILLVDDNQINRILARAMLDKLELAHDIAVNGLEAFQLVCEGDFALVLMDVEMPEMDGIEATRRIRAREIEEGRQHLPIVAMTANALQGDRDRCFDSGMDGYVAKPIHFGKLKAEIYRVMIEATGNSASQREISTPDQTRKPDEKSSHVSVSPADDDFGKLSPAAPAAEGSLSQSGSQKRLAEAARQPLATPTMPVRSVCYDREAAIQRLEDEDLFQVLLDMFCEEVPKDLLAIDEALSRLDWSVLVRAAHTLKGHFGGFCAPDAAAAALALEKVAKDVSPSIVDVTQKIAMLKREIERFLADVEFGKQDALRET